MSDFQLLRKLKPGAEKGQALVAEAASWSKTAGDVAHRMETLEAALRDEVMKTQELEQRCAVAEESYRRTLEEIKRHEERHREQVEQIQTKLDYFQTRFLEQNGKARAVAGILLEVIKESEKDIKTLEEGKDTFRPKPRAQRELARAIAPEEQGDQQPVPEFLHRKKEDASGS